MLPQVLRNGGTASCATFEGSSSLGKMGRLLCSSRQRTLWDVDVDKDTAVTNLLRQGRQAAPLRAARRARMHPRKQNCAVAWCLETQRAQGSIHALSVAGAPKGRDNFHLP